MSIVDKYGKLALVAGASEGLGGSFAESLANANMDLILVARNKERLDQFAKNLIAQYGISVECIVMDLSHEDATKILLEKVKDKEINLLIYNAALSYISPFETQSLAQNDALAQLNIITPMNLVHALAKPMLSRGCGGIILMASMAGLQGSGFLATYAASKAFTRIFAESLWYEWKDKGVDVMACCAGATATPNYERTQPEKTSFFAPKVQTPEEVVNECLRNIGKKPSIISGRGNRIASFFMQKIIPRKKAITIMGDNTRKMYRI